MATTSEKLPESLEMYLETILLLQNKGEKVRQVDIARAMGFARPSVHATVNKLMDMGLLKTDTAGGIDFTPAGKKLAQDVYERHYVFAHFLVSIGVDPITAQADACKIEHDVSQMTFERIKAFCERNCPPLLDPED